MQLIGKRRGAIIFGGKNNKEVSDNTYYKCDYDGKPTGASDEEVNDTEKEEYDKYWDDISPFIKFGCLKDDKFCEKMTDYILFKNLDGKYMTLPECLEVKPIDVEGENAVDENGEVVEAEVVEDEAAEESKEVKK